MKQTLVMAIAVLAVACGGGQAIVSTGEGTVFDISPAIIEARTDTLIDVGKISEGEIVQYNASIRNAGSEPLVIVEVVTSCGCTSVEYEKQPIAPGASAEFSLRFDSSGMRGMQHKLIEINTNASPRGYRIALQAEVTYNEISNY